MTATPKSITEDELAEALRRRSYLPDPDGYACEILADILAHREPRHKPGAYEDGEGNLHVRVAGLNAWLRVMDDGTTEVRPDDWVEPPLRRLVPEHTHPDEAAILAAIVAWTAESNLYQNLARRLCRLMEGGGDA